ncbi:hypothetical protein DSO57_1038407 [Entomophthora muscae]|uniref:Uncharacterized protein n=1 Tax=Entomophthora muscae TaxID=34485 RepID=A0ACC2SBF6_9FUNG|nr:hypothetical protein DSO57_1038407 [Entomophthora muscae]
MCLFPLLLLASPLASASFPLVVIPPPHTILAHHYQIKYQFCLYIFYSSVCTKTTTIPPKQPLPHFTTVLKLTRNYTKVTTTKTVNGVTTKMVSFVYDHVYCCDGVPDNIMEKIEPVLDTSYKPYVIDGKKHNDDNKPQYFQTTKGQKVLKN